MQPDSFIPKIYRIGQREILMENDKLVLFDFPKRKILGRRAARFHSLGRQWSYLNRGKMGVLYQMSVMTSIVSPIKKAQMI